jgi:hypothetical protein
LEPPMPRQEGDVRRSLAEAAIDPDLVEYLVITIEGLSQTAPVARALQQLVETSQIQILDLVGVEVDDVGGYAAVEPELMEGFADLRAVEGEIGGLLSEDDIALGCRGMSPGTSALILLVEDRWGRPLADAVRESGGRIVGGERIPRDRFEQSWRAPLHGDVEGG